MINSILHLGEIDSIGHRRLASAFTEFFDDPEIVIYSASESDDEYTQIFENESFAETVFDERLDSWPPDPPDVDYLKQFEAEHGAGTVWRCLSTDRSLVKRGITGKFHIDESPFTHDELLALAETRVRLLTDLFESYEFDFVYGQNYGNLGGMIAYTIASNRDIPFYRFRSTRVSDRFAIHEGITEDSDRLLRAKTAAQTDPDPFPIEAARDHISAVRSGSPAYEMPDPDIYDELRSEEETQGKLAKLPRAVREYYAIRFGSGPGRQTPVLERKYWELLKKVRAKTQPYTVDFDEFDPNQSYVYFPLHAQPEISLMVWARYLTDQPAVVRNVAQSLPAGMELYVNEHPYMNGARRSGYYDRLRRLPNVRILPRSVNSSRVMDDAEAVVTISSTAGLEALVRGVPVLALGRPGYRKLHMVHTLDGYEELTETLVDAVAAGVDMDEVRAYVAAALEAGVPRDHPDFPRKICEQIDEELTRRDEERAQGAV